MDRPTVLLVEDEAIVALDLKARLGDLGYRVCGVADTGEQALELARRERPELILMDVNLRGAMDGIEVAATLRREGDLPVVFLTSFSDPQTVRRAALTAPYGYLTKPFQPRELAAGLEVALFKSRMERQLRDSDRWFASTLRCVSDGVVLTEPDRTIRFMNPAAEAITGWSLEEARGRPIDEIARFERDGDAASAVLAEGRVTPVEHGLELQPRGAEACPVDRSAAPIHDGAGAPMGGVLVLRDARERLRQEARLRASEERFRNAFELAPLGMALLSLDGRYLLVNEAYCALVGRSAEELATLREADLGAPDDAAHEAQRLNELLGGGETVVQFEKRYLHACGGGPVCVLVSASLLHDDDAAPTCLLYQVHDLTEQKRAAAQLAELAEERMKREASEAAGRMRGDFLARVSHEMRTPLNAVLGFGQLLQLQADTSADKRTMYAEHIVAAGKHLLSMVNDLLEMQRIDRGDVLLRMQRLELGAALQEALRLLQPSADAQQIAWDIDLPDALHAWADPTRLRQVLLNIGSNAVKYNRIGGRVSWSAARSGDRVRISVTDEGIGMTEEQVRRLFQPFERLGRETSAIPGTGLGLIIARGLAERMDGALTLFSEPRRGTSVVLELRAG